MQDKQYDHYEQKLGGLIISFTLDKSNNNALFNNISYPQNHKLSHSMILKFFCTLVRNSISDLITMNIKKIYHFALKEEYEEFKDKTKWNVELWDITIYNYDPNVIFLSCDIINFIENIDKSHELK